MPHCSATDALAQGALHHAGPQARRVWCFGAFDRLRSSQVRGVWAPLRRLAVMLSSVGLGMPCALTLRILITTKSAS